MFLFCCVQPFLIIGEPPQALRLKGVLSAYAKVTNFFYTRKGKGRKRTCKSVFLYKVAQHAPLSITQGRRKQTYTPSCKQHETSIAEHTVKPSCLCASSFTPHLHPILSCHSVQHSCTLSTTSAKVACDCQATSCKDAVQCVSRCSAVRGRMQCSAWTDAVQCVGECSAVRGQMQCSA